MQIQNKYVMPYLTLALAFAFVLFSEMAHATLLLDTETAVNAAAADALTIGGYVVGGICSLLVIGLAIKMVRKLAIVAGAGVAGAMSAMSDAHATLLTDTDAAITAAAADALTIGSYVVGGICSLLVIGLAIRMVRKL